MLKVAGATPAAPAPSAPSAEPTPSADNFGPEMDTEAPQSSSNEKPFDDTPFDAGVEADEETDPKKFIEQLTGKLGQSLRKYTEEQGQPDFELEKFAINSLISATHTSEMDEEDKNDIIKKINQAGEKDSEPEASMDSEPSAEAEPSADSTGGEEAPSDAKPVDEMSNLFVDAKKNNMFQPNSNDILKEDGENTEDFSVGDIVSMQGSSSKWKITGIVKPNSVGQIRIFITRIEDDGSLSVSTETSGKISSPPSPRISKISGINENMGESNNYMFWQNLNTIYDSAKDILEMDCSEVDMLLSDGHGWALDHAATSADDVEEVYHFLESMIHGYRSNSLKEIMGEGEHESNNYMFWLNLKTICHATKEMLEMDCSTVDSILSDGHAWAIEHITTSKDDIEEVYHFLSGMLDSYEEHDYEEWSKPMQADDSVKASDSLQYHLDNGIALGESVYRYGSKEFFNLLKEVKELYTKGLISLNENDAFIVEDFDNSYVRVGEDKHKMNFIFEEIQSKELNEAEYQGKKVQLGKPKRGGSKKFYVYVKNPKTGKVKKVSFGAKAGGGNLAVKLRDPKARKAFADRHNCKAKNDKTKPGYWACRLPRYAKLLGLSGGGTWW